MVSMGSDVSNLTEKEEEIEALRQELLNEKAMLVRNTDMFQSSKLGSDSRDFSMAMKSTISPRSTKIV